MVAVYGCSQLCTIIHIILTPSDDSTAVIQKIEELHAWYFHVNSITVHSHTYMYNPNNCHTQYSHPTRTIKSGNIPSVSYNLLSAP